MPSDTRFPTSQSLETLAESKPTKAFVAACDGYSGYYAVWEAARMHSFEILHVGCVESAAARLLEVIPEQVQSQMAGSHKSPLKVVSYQIDLMHPDSITEAARGMDVALIIPPANAHKVQYTENVIKGIKDAGIKALVLMSSVAADLTHPAKESFQQFGQIERMLMDHDIESTCIVRSAFFFQNLLLYANQIRADPSFLSLPLGEARFAPVDLQDVMGCAIRCAQDIPHHAGQVYILTGPHLIDGEDIAAACSTILGKSIEWKACDLKEAEDVLKVKPGLDVSEARYLLDSYELVAGNHFSFVTNCVREILKKAPTDIQNFFRKHLLDLTDPQRAHLKAEGQ